MKFNRVTGLLAIGLVATLFGSACQTDLDIERYEYECTSSADCTGGYECADLQDRRQTICVPPDEVELCATAGDEDGDGAADCADDECAEFEGCSVDAGRDAESPDVGEDADTSDVDASDASDAEGDVEADAAPNDSDGDGVADDEDNCPNHPNPAQRPSSTDLGLACASSVSASEAGAVRYEGSSLPAPDLLASSSQIAGIAVLDDLDGDNLDDLAVGTPAAINGAGAVTILFSSKSSSSLDSSDYIRISGQVGQSGFGSSVAAIGDVTGDGKSDLAVLHPDWSDSPDATFPVGAVLIYSSQQLLNPSPDGPAVFATLTGENSGALAKGHIHAIGDVDGGSKPDFAVGAPDAFAENSERRGGVYIVAGESLHSTAPISLGDSLIELIGEVDSGFGTAIASGQFDDDGVVDIALGLPRSGRGQVILLPGQVLRGELGGNQPGPVSFDLANSGSFTRIETSDSSGDFGASIALDGSIDGDEYDDLIISAKWAASSVGPLAGSVHVVPGGSGRITMVGGDIEADTAAYKISGVETQELLGTSIEYVGDVNDDGRDDLVVGAKDHGSNSSGAAYLLVGPYSSSSSPLQVTDVAVPFYGTNDDDNFGLHAARIGNFLGDGYPDFAIYSPSGEYQSQSGAEVVDAPMWYLYAGPFYR